MILKLVVAIYGLMYFFLLIDPGITSIVLAAIAALVSIATLYFQSKTVAKLKEVSKQIDGQQTMLIDASKGQSKAEGKLETKDEVIEILKQVEPLKEK